MLFIAKHESLKIEAFPHSVFVSNRGMTRWKSPAMGLNPQLFSLLHYCPVPGVLYLEHVIVDILDMRFRFKNNLRGSFIRRG